MQPVIRRYEAADLDAVISVFLRSVRGVASRDYDAGQIAAWAQVDRDVWSRRRLDRPTWVGLIDGVIAGFIDLESSGHIDMLFVDPASQRRGVASALLDAVENAARVQRARGPLHRRQHYRAAVLRKAWLSGHPFASGGTA
ncbi:GNAT family N-acetyltransferase [Caballeronia sp. dw_19]|uniref:GNAT family N-acetyltransferase n=1 Tax=Caballeronia sp. dw_19 TaxID=2719791 RepID=UPI002107B899|nr:GNAT family N-acetyltransferase [Caballeronia sp. dw_19]